MRRGLLETVGALSLALAAGYLAPAGARPPNPIASADPSEDYADIHRRIQRQTKSAVTRVKDIASPSNLAGGAATASDPAVEEYAAEPEIADVGDFDLADLTVGVSSSSEIARDESEAGVGDSAGRDVGYGRGVDEVIVDAGWAATISSDKASKRANRAISLIAKNTRSNTRRVARTEDNGDDDGSDDAGGSDKSGGKHGIGNAKGSSKGGSGGSNSGSSSSASKSSGGSSKGSSGSGGESGSGDGGRSSSSGSGSSGSGGGGGRSSSGSNSGSSGSGGSGGHGSSGSGSGGSGGDD